MQKCILGKLSSSTMSTQIESRRGCRVFRFCCISWLKSGIFGGSLDEFFRKPNEMMKFNIYIQLRLWIMPDDVLCFKMWNVIEIYPQLAERLTETRLRAFEALLFFNLRTENCSRKDKVFLIPLGWLDGKVFLHKFATSFCVDILNRHKKTQIRWEMGDARVTMSTASVSRVKMNNRAKDFSSGMACYPSDASMVFLNYKNSLKSWIKNDRNIIRYSSTRYWSIIAMEPSFTSLDRSFVKNLNLFCSIESFENVICIKK